MVWDDVKATFGTMTATEYNNMVTFIKSVISSSGNIGLGTPTNLTIATGVITKTGSYHTVDTEASASTDDLDTINGGSIGDILFLTATDSTRTVVVKDNIGNLQLSGDFSLDNIEDTIQLLYNGTNWLEISRSNNGV